MRWEMATVWTSAAQNASSARIGNLLLVNGL